MYDSQVNSTEIQENVTGSFSNVSSGLTSGPMVRRKGLPEWAINWSKNRFGLDAGGVNLCIVDKQEGDEPFAAASGNKIFVTSEYKNNKSVIMHEITHIYQQAVGSATESNVGDQSLEDEAVKVSNGEEILLSKKQDLSDKYIVPKENTNIVQSFGGLALGLLLGGIFLAGAATVGAVSLLTRHMKCKKIAKETGVSIDCVKMVYKAFGWAEARFGLDDFKELCKVVYDKNITWEKLKSDGEALKNNHGEDGIERYIVDLKSEGSEVVKKESENTGAKVAPQTGVKENKIPEPKPIESEPVVSVTIGGDGTTITSEHTKNYKNATNVTIGGKVKEIGGSAFSGFPKLKEIQIPEDVTTIGFDAFSNCNELEKIVLHNQLHTIGRGAFSGCKGLKKIEIPDNITEISDSTFDFCFALNQIKLPHGLKKIGEKAFHFCKSLNNIDLPDSIEEIGERAFNGCGKIEKIVLPKGLKEVSGSLVSQCGSLKEINLPEVMTEVKDATFSECKNLEKIALPERITKIGSSAFAGCESLTEIVNFPKELQEIGSAAFRGCSDLKNVGVPSGIPKIGANTFRNCKGMKEANIPEGVKLIDYQAFQDCTNLERVSIPGSVVNIDKNAFINCKDLVKVDMHEGVKSIGEHTFDGCTNLEKVSIPKSVESIGDYAFADCDNLVDVNNFPKSCGKNAFLNCARLNLPAGIDNGIKHDNVSDKSFIYKDDKEKKKSLKRKSINDMPLFSEGGPKMEDVQQGYIGDCWLMASLASIVKNNPKTIENIMKDNEDGTVDVTLQRESESGRFKKEVYTVKKSLFRIKQGLFSLGVMSESQENIWVQMIEKAFSAYFAKGNESINYYNIDGGGSDNKDAFKIILGKEAKGYYRSDALSGDRKELFERIKGALDSKIPLYYAVGKKEDVVKDVDGDKLITTHAFSLIGAEEKDGRYYITLRNPWGFNRNKCYRRKNAIIKVDLGDATNVIFRIANLGRK